MVQSDSKRQISEPRKDKHSQDEAFHGPESFFVCKAEPVQATSQAAVQLLEQPAFAEPLKSGQGPHTNSLQARAYMPAAVAGVPCNRKPVVEMWRPELVLPDFCGQFPGAIVRR